MRRTALILILPFFATLFACGGGGDHSSPKAVAEALTQSLSDHDAARAVGLLPTAAQIEAYFDCSEGDSLVESRNKRASRAAKEFAPKEGEEFEMKLDEFDLEGSETKAIKAGEEWNGCKVRKDIEVHKSKMKFTLTKDGESKSDGERWPFIKLDGKWYFAKF